MNVEHTEAATGFSLGILLRFDLFDLSFDTELLFGRHELVIEECEVFLQFILQGQSVCGEFFLDCFEMQFVKIQSYLNVVHPFCTS